MPGRRARQAARARPAVLPGASTGTAGAAQGVWSRPRGPRRVQAGPPSHQRSSEALPEPDPILCQLVPTAGAPWPGHWWPHQVYRPPLDTGWRGPAQTARELSPSGLRGAPARRRPPRALPPRPLAIGLLGTAGPSEPPGRGPSGLMVHVAQCAPAWQPPGPLEAAAAGPHRRFLSCAGIPLPRPSARPRFPTRPSELASGQMVAAPPSAHLPARRTAPPHLVCPAESPGQVCPGSGCPGPHLLPGVPTSAVTPPDQAGKNQSIKRLRPVGQVVSVGTALLRPCNKSPLDDTRMSRCGWVPIKLYL